MAPGPCRCSGLRAAALACIAAAAVDAVHSIDDYGAVANNATLSAATANGRALYNAVAAANASVADRTVVVPAGATYTLLPLGVMRNLHGVTLLLDGALSCWPDQATWPNDTAGNALNMIEFYGGDGLTLAGRGTVIGNGNPWWNAVWSPPYVDNRPHLLVVTSVRNVEFHHWTMLNSPQYHAWFVDVADVLITGVTVYVDVEGQREILRRHGKLSDGSGGMPAGVPTFPLNTDGIDIGGRNITNFE